MGESILVSNFRKSAGKIDKKIREATGDVAYPTGFLTLDYLNGAMIHVKNPQKNMDFYYPSVGVLDGAGTMLIGRTGCGKSTLMLQMAANIIRPFKTSSIFYNDIEGGMADSSMETLCQMTSDDLQGRLFYRNEGITTENIYKMVQWISDEKTNNRDIYEYDTGLYDMHGERIFKLEPTILCIDSWPVLMPESVTEEDSMSGQMTTTASVKRAADLVKRIVSVEKAANIIVFTINHIMDDIQTGPFHKKTQTAYLKQGERLPGGKTALYLANNMFRLDDGTKLKESEGLGVSGFIVDVSCVKSRTNKAGKSVPLVFTGSKGFDPDLSMYMYLKSEGYLCGAGSSYYFEGFPEYKFAQKNFISKLYSDPEFQQIFAQVSYKALQPLLSQRTYKQETVGDNVFDINKIIMEMNKAEMAA
jgi:RecA/RadA recombinase